MTTLLRNIGISAHVDAGKTTLAERILFYAGAIRAMHEVKDRQGGGAHMDHDPLEADMGITIDAAATRVRWGDAEIHVVDTPGHVDFTVEVERALRVLDGAVLVLSAVAGVQAQTRTVQRQMARYGVPCVAFVNKCDLPGADPGSVVDAMTAELGLPAVLMQWPLGLEGEHYGSIDLLTQESITFEGPANARVVREPVVLEGAALGARETLLEAAAEHDDELFEALVEGRPPDVARVKRVLAEATHARKLVPVFVGSARQNLGVQPLLDGVVDYLPGPAERRIDAVDPETGAAVEVRADPEGPVLTYAFKLQETDFGALTWLRVYRGRLRSGASLVDVRTGRKQRVRRLFRLDAGTTVPVAEAGPGEVVAVSGLDVASGTSLADPAGPLSIGSMHVPEPVVRRSLVLDRGDEERLGRGLSKLVREDPTLRVVTDPETGETVLCGMGELHLEVVATRLHQRFGVEVQLGEPTVAARQALTQAARFDHLFKRQKGGPGLWARIVGTVEPAVAFELEWAVVGGAIPTTYRSAVERGLRQALAEAQPEVIGARVVITDGATHSTDSSDVAFEFAARMAFREVLADTVPVRLEPWVRVVAEAPEAMHGALVQSLTSRRGRVLDAEPGRVEAEVPLARMFGYATALRSLTSGEGTFGMEFDRFAEVA